MIWPSSYFTVGLSIPKYSCFIVVSVDKDCILKIISPAKRAFSNFTLSIGLNSDVGLS